MILCSGKANIPSCKNRNLHGPASGVLWPTPSSVLQVGKEPHAPPAPLGTGSPTEICTGTHASALGSVCSLPTVPKHSLSPTPAEQTSLQITGLEQHKATCAWAAKRRAGARLKSQTGCLGPFHVISTQPPLTASFPKSIRGRGVLQHWGSLCWPNL